MKFVIVVVAFAVLLMLLRGLVRRTRDDAPPRRGPGPADASPQALLACAQCGVRLPRDEALPGRGGVFCGEAHRAAYERQHPAP